MSGTWAYVGWDTSYQLLSTIITYYTSHYLTTISDYQPSSTVVHHHWKSLKLNRSLMTMIHWPLKFPDTEICWIIVTNYWPLKSRSSEMKSLDPTAQPWQPLQLQQDPKQSGLPPAAESWPSTAEGHSPTSWPTLTIGMTSRYQWSKEGQSIDTEALLMTASSVSIVAIKSGRNDHNYEIYCKSCIWTSRVWEKEGICLKILGAHTIDSDNR